MTNGDSDDRFQEQIEKARMLLRRQVANQTYDQVTRRIEHLERIGCQTTAENVRRARDAVFGPPAARQERQSETAR